MLCSLVGNVATTTKVFLDFNKPLYAVKFASLPVATVDNQPIARYEKIYSFQGRSCLKNEPSATSLTCPMCYTRVRLVWWEYGSPMQC